MPLGEAMSLRLAQGQVRAWRAQMGLGVAPTGAPIEVRNPMPHIEKMREECREFCEAALSGNVAHAAKEAGDIVVVTLGWACEAGLRLGPVFDEVMFSNWTKTPGNLSPSGLLLKGENYRPANIGAVLRLQGWVQR